MSFQAMADVIKLRLPTNEKFILLMLANYADQDGKCWPSIARLAADTGLHESSVKRALHVLRSYSGLVGIESGGGVQSNRYVLGFDVIHRMLGEGVQAEPGFCVSSGGVQGEPPGGFRVSYEPINEPISEPTKAPAAPLPSWVPADAWELWRKHRGRKLTAQARKAQLSKLATLRLQGHDPAAVIALAIESGWSTFYPPRPATKRDKHEAVSVAIWGDKAPALRRHKTVEELFSDDKPAIGATCERIS
jgi:hypothetical protein